jgi:hypothetical protein
VKVIPPTGATDRDRDFAIIDLIKGRNNAVGTVTLAVSPATTTTIANTNISENGGVFLFPKTANASAFYIASSLYGVVTKGTVTLTHAASANVDNTFYYVVLGG